MVAVDKQQVAEAVQQLMHQLKLDTPGNQLAKLQARANLLDVVTCRLESIDATPVCQADANRGICCCTGHCPQLPVLSWMHGNMLIMLQTSECVLAQAATNLVSDQLLPALEDSQLSKAAREAATQLSHLDVNKFPLGFSTGGIAVVCII